MTNKLWQCPLEVKRGTYAEMPDTWSGAAVSVYVGARSYEEALTQAVTLLQSKGMEFVDIIGGNVIQLDPNQWWDGYVMENYAEFCDEFPSQEDVLIFVEEGQLFHGPFAGWE